MFGQLIEEIRGVVEGGGSRRAKVARQAAHAGEQGVRAAKKNWRIYPSPESERSKVSGLVKHDRRVKKFYRSRSKYPPDPTGLGTRGRGDRGLKIPGPRKGILP